MALDYGTRRIGVAVSDPDGIMAMPVAVLHVNGLRDALRQVLACCAERDVRLIVIGLPLNMDGSAGSMATEVRAFAERLRQAKLDVVEWDERLTSYSADQTMIELGVRSRDRKRALDKMAAQQILQGYLDSAAGEDGPITARDDGER